MPKTRELIASVFLLLVAACMVGCGGGAGGGTASSVWSDEGYSSKWEWPALFVPMSYAEVSDTFGGQEPSTYASLDGSGTRLAATFDCDQAQDCPYKETAYVRLFLIGEGFVEEDGARFGELWDSGDYKRYVSVGWYEPGLSTDGMNQRYWDLRRELYMPEPYAVLDKPSGNWADSLVAYSVNNEAANMEITMGQAFGEGQVDGKDGYWHLTLSIFGEGDTPGVLSVEYHALDDGAEYSSYEEIEEKNGLISYKEAIKTAGNPQGSQGSGGSFLDGIAQVVRNYVFQVAVAVGVLLVFGAVRRRLVHAKRNSRKGTSSKETKQDSKSSAVSSMDTAGNKGASLSRAKVKTSIKEEDDYYNFADALLSADDHAIRFVVDSDIQYTYRVLSESVSSHYDVHIEDWGNKNKVLCVSLRPWLDSTGQVKYDTVYLTLIPLSKTTVIQVYPKQWEVSEVSFDEVTVRELSRESGVAIGEFVSDIRDLAILGMEGKEYGSTEEFIQSLSSEDSMAWLGVDASWLKSAKIEHRVLPEEVERMFGKPTSSRPLIEEGGDAMSSTGVAEAPKNSLGDAEQFQSGSPVEKQKTTTSEADLVGLLVAGVGEDSDFAASILSEHSQLSIEEARTFFSEIPKEKWADMASEYIRRLSSE